MHDLPQPPVEAVRPAVQRVPAVVDRHLHATALDAPVITIAGKDVPMPYAANLEKLALPNVGEVVEAVKAVTYR